MRPFDLATLADAQARIPQRPRDAHKGLFGHVLCIGGGRGMGGALALCVEAALRAGAGRVSAATRAEHVAVLLARRPECMVHAVESPSDIAELMASADVIAIGPGLGRDVWAKSLLDAALATRRPLVIDADALTLIAADPRPLPAGSVITPHPGEAARLLGIPTDEVQANREDAAQTLADRYHCIAVLKGHGTLVAATGERTRMVDGGNPGMASAGMGDALTGIVSALCAQHQDAFEAAWIGAVLHAAAGDAVCAMQGEYGLLASDLIAALPSVFPQRMSA
ncbi:YjeF family C-terminal domain-containing protein [Lysobacter silvestris]|uniref:ADP-dependent (S)-NAD(P)H-hydrate dehydratase n=1 Tax=Solilutibacter silvestris TaxID=1645665 RepID=A0A2K1PYW3_9GAMM|nr:YjeF family C-terminal domain-containing protein [Lysobacter silvestris]